MKNLAAELPDTIMNKWSYNTIKQYSCAWKAWLTWACQYSEIVSLPAKPMFICLYLISMAQRRVSVATLNNAVSAINWKHKAEGYESPTTDNTLNLCIDGLKRALSRPINKSSPILPQHIDKIVQEMDKGSLVDLRTVSLILLAFSGFMRFGEVSTIRREDIYFADTHMTIQIKHSKTDQLRSGSILYIAKTGSINCPVSMLKSYLQMAGIVDEDNCFIYRNIRFAKGVLVLCGINKAISYTRTREVVKEKFESIGLKADIYTLHSLRSGGASAAARQNIPDRLFQRHGRWSTDSVKNGYINESLENLLMVSKNLGL